MTDHHLEPPATSAPVPVSAGSDTVRSDTVGSEPASSNLAGDGLDADASGRTNGATAAPAKRRVSRTVVEWVVLVIAAVVIALVIKTFLFQAFFIPSASMDPTLKVGDRVLVNKLSYDLHDVHRGDIVVFSSEPNEQWHRAGIDDLVKRVIALPGETITSCGNDELCIDGRVLKESYLPKDVLASEPWPDGVPQGCDPKSPAGGCTVPAGRYFVMGDNRANSADSRLHGPIKGSSIVGRVFVRIWPPNRIGFL